MIKSLAGLKRALQPGAVVTMMASESHPNSDLIGVPRTVVKADAEKVGFDTVHADGSHTISYLHWPKDDSVQFIEDGFGFITHGATYWIDKEAHEVADSSTKTAAVTVTCPNGHRNPEGQHFCGECGEPIAKGPDKSAAKLLALAQEAEAEADKADARAKAIHTARTTSEGQGVTTPSPPGWYPDPSGKPGKLYWDGYTWRNAIPAPQPPGRVNWPGLIAVGVGLVLVLIVVAQCSTAGQGARRQWPTGRKGCRRRWINFRLLTEMWKTASAGLCREVISPH